MALVLHYFSAVQTVQCWPQCPVCASRVCPNDFSHLLKLSKCSSKVECWGSINNTGGWFHFLPASPLPSKQSKPSFPTDCSPARPQASWVLPTSFVCLHSTQNLEQGRASSPVVDWRRYLWASLLQLWASPLQIQASPLKLWFHSYHWLSLDRIQKLTAALLLPVFICHSHFQRFTFALLMVACLLHLKVKNNNAYLKIQLWGFHKISLWKVLIIYSFPKYFKFMSQLWSIYYGWFFFFTLWVDST